MYHRCIESHETTKILRSHYSRERHECSKFQLQSPEDGFTQDQGSSTSVAMGSNPPTTSGNTCESCSNVESLISVMMSKLTDLERIVKQQQKKKSRCFISSSNDKSSQHILFVQQFIGWCNTIYLLNFMILHRLTFINFLF